MNNYPEIIEGSTCKLRPHLEKDMEDVIRVGYDPELFRGIGSEIPSIPIGDYASIWLRLKQWNALGSAGKRRGVDYALRIEQKGAAVLMVGKADDPSP